MDMWECGGGNATIDAGIGLPEISKSFPNRGAKLASPSGKPFARSPAA
jgi:hypothetical protein